MTILGATGQVGREGEVLLQRIVSHHPIWTLVIAFLVAIQLWLIFGPMRDVNLALGSPYLLCCCLGFAVSERTESWLLAFPVVFVVVAGLILQHQAFRWLEGVDLRPSVVTTGLSVMLADLVLWIRGGQCHGILTPDLLSGPVALPVISSARENTGAVIGMSEQLGLAVWPQGLLGAGR